MNPFSSAKIIGTNVNPKMYHERLFERGEPEFVMSKSELIEFDHCPRRWIRGYKRKDTDSLEWGQLIDTLVLSPDRFDEVFAVEPETYTNDKGEVKKWSNNSNAARSWKEEQIGKSIVSAEDKNCALGAVKMLMADREIEKLLYASERQVYVLAEYRDKETGLAVSVKCLIDLVPDSDGGIEKALADLKTATSADPGAWARQVFQLGYHVQAALYLDVFNAATGEDRTDFLHIVQENYGPYETGRRILSQEFIELGRMKYVTALRRYCACLKSNEWNGYEPGGVMLNGFRLTEPAPWMLLSESDKWLPEAPTPKPTTVSEMPS